MRGGRSLLIAAGIATAGPFVLLALQSFRTPDVLRYMPSSAAVVIVIPQIQETWRILDSHLSRMDRGWPCKESIREGAGDIGNALANVRCELEKFGLKTRNLDDLSKEGIDITRGVAIGSTESLGINLMGGEAVIALPIKNRAAFCESAHKLEHSIDAHCRINAPEGWIKVLKITDDNYAILSNAPALADRALGSQSDNLSFWLAADQLSGMLHSALAGAQSSNAVTILSLRPMPMVGIVYGNQSSLGISAVTEPDVLSSHEKRFLSTPLPKSEVADLEDQYPLLAAASDQDLQAMLQSEREFNPSAYRKILKALVRPSASYALLADELATAPSFSSLGVVITDSRGGVPEVAFALDLSRGDADEMVLRLQRENYTKRQCAILNAASEKFLSASNVCRSDGSSTGTPTNGSVLAHSDLTTLLQWGAISEKPELLPFDATRKPTEVPRSVFEGPAYTTCLGISPCTGRAQARFVAPMVNENDFQWLIKNATPAEQESLRAGEYRLVSYYDDARHRLWLALDLLALQHALRSDPATQSYTQTKAKIHVHFDPAWLWLHSTVGADHDTQDTIRSFAGDLRIYRNGDITITPLDDRKGVSLDVRFEF